MFANSYLSRTIARCAAGGVTLAALTVSTVFTHAQGVPHLSVNPSTYHTLIPPGATITSAMCQAADSYCLSHDVGQSLAGSLYAADSKGNVYVGVANLIYKMSPQGQIAVIAGQYGQALTGGVPLTLPPFSPIGPFTSMVVDGSGNIYIGRLDYHGFGYDGTQGSLLKIDALGVTHRLTATAASASASPVEDALASTQYVNPFDLAVDAEGSLYVSDAATFTVRKLSASTGRLDTVIGCLASGCSLAGSPASGARASQYNIGGYVAVGKDGTLYDSDFVHLYSIADGIFHLIATEGYYVGTGGYAIPGPVGGGGNIGTPIGHLTVDGGGNLYFVSQGEDYFSLEGNLLVKLVEVTKGTPASPAQVLVLATGPEGDPPYLAFPVINPEGMPSTLTLGLPGAFTLDAAGRIITATPATTYQVQDYYQYAYYPGAYAGPEATGIAYLDRNGSAVFDNGQYETTPQPTSPQIITLTNSGDAPLKTVDIAGTGFPYYLLPTAAELKAEGADGPVPFTLDQKVGTCLARYAPTGTLTLAPGESCTLAFDYTPDARQHAGSFTLYTNDPRGPLTVNLTASRLGGGGLTSGYIDETSFGSYYDVTLSATTLTPSALTSSTGDFIVAASVASGQGFLDYFNDNMDLGISYFAIADLPFIPTGRIYAAASNNATGATTYSSVNTLDADGKTTFTFTGLAAGTYSLEAFYLGDGSNSPSYSTVQTLTVAR